MSTRISISIQINAPIEKVWQLWTTPADICQWNNISDQWHTPKAENDLRPGGRFIFTMGLKDGSFAFDFSGIYDEVVPHKLLSYTLDDKRRSTITFEGTEPVKLTESFQPNDTDPIDMQHEFCRAVLLSFKNYAEAKVD